MALCEAPGTIHTSAPGMALASAAVSRHALDPGAHALLAGLLLVHQGLSDGGLIEAYAELALLHPTFPIYEALNPAMAEVGSENAFMNAVMDVMKEGMTPEAAIDKAFKRAEAIFAKYPIVQS